MKKISTSLILLILLSLFCINFCFSQSKIDITNTTFLDFLDLDEKELLLYGFDEMNDFKKILTFLPNQMNNTLSEIDSLRLELNKNSKFINSFMDSAKNLTLDFTYQELEMKTERLITNVISLFEQIDNNSKIYSAQNREIDSFVRDVERFKVNFNKLIYPIQEKCNNAQSKFTTSQNHFVGISLVKLIDDYNHFLSDESDYSIDIFVDSWYTMQNSVEDFSKEYDAYYDNFIKHVENINLPIIKTKLTEIIEYKVILFHIKFG